MIDVPITVRDALRAGEYKKNYVIQVLNDNGYVSFTIDNKNLVTESVSIDERMCSGDTIKFGLCEGSSLEFQYFDKENITGRQIKVFVDVDYMDKGIEYITIAQFEKFVTQEITEAGTYRVYSEQSSGFQAVWLTRGYSVIISTPTTDSSGTYCTIECQAGDQLEVEWTGQVYDTYLQKVIDNSGEKTYRIPMGYYTVQKCSRQASTGIIKATAFNKLQSDYLDTKANDLIIESYNQAAQDPYITSISLDYLLRQALSDYSIDVTNLIEIYKSTPVEVIHSTSFRYENQTLAYSYNVTVPIVDFYTDEDLEEYADGTGSHLSGYYKVKISGLTAARAAILEHCSEVEYAIDTYDRSYFDLLFCLETPWGYDERVDLFDVTGDTYELPYIQGLLDRHISFTDGDYHAEYNSFFAISVPYGNLSDVPLADRITVNTYAHNFIMQYLTVEFIRQESTDGLGAITANINEIENWPDVTFRDLQSAVFESVCQFGQLDRETDLFLGVELNQTRLLPAETIYPANDLYPGGAALSATRAMYSKLWADEGNVHKWRYLIITYKGLDENNQETEMTLQRTVNADGTDDYNCSDNWLFKNLVWDASDIGDYADAMVAKMQDITWFPFEMWCAGLPYLETGDEIEIPLGENAYTSYILQRQLKGIQNLQDTYINGTLDIF